MTEVEQAIFYHTEQARQLWKQLWYASTPIEIPRLEREVAHHEAQISLLINLALNDIEELPDGYKKE